MDAWYHSLTVFSPASFPVAFKRWRMSSLTPSPQATFTPRPSQYRGRENTFPRHSIEHVPQHVKREKSIQLHLFSHISVFCRMLFPDAKSTTLVGRHACMWALNGTLERTM